jgi:membrane protease YdiL (CAAX protease family)
MTFRAVSFARTIWALLRAARKRAFGRTKRLRRLRSQRGGAMSVAWPILAMGFFFIVSALVNFGAGFFVLAAIDSGERVEVEARGKLIVDEWFASGIPKIETAARRNPAVRKQADQYEDLDVEKEATRLAHARDADAGVIAAKLRAAIRAEPGDILITESQAHVLARTSTLPNAMVTLFLVLWCAMLICQGEGPELDTQQPRHPMWEWLFSHPATPSAIFLAEMLAPIAANPFYLTAPLFPGLLYGVAYGWVGGVVGGLIVGAPVAIALACVGKAIEINVMLRFSPRVRGAILGLMGWFGFASVLAFVILAGSFFRIISGLAEWLLPLAGAPWPPVRALVGQAADGSFSFWRGVLLCWAISALLMVVAVAISVASARRGLAGNFSLGAGASRAKGDGRSRFGREPLYRKELLWFRRDGAALVQVVLVPLSLAALQLFNLRRLLDDADSAWNYLCGAAILFGTYFLMILGPKSLASEGPALWIALTWPRGLESLLKVKARLWAGIASGVVAIILAYAAFRFPGYLWQIGAVAIGWFVFARTLAEKTVTLATVASSSGEPGKVPNGLRWAASIGTLTFAVGVLTRQWSIAITGVVYSQLTAAAMWQNFRSRLPYLYDPWSETLPPAPTLMHAMVGVSAMVEGAAVLSGGWLWWRGREELVFANTLIYGVCAISTSLLIARFLRSRGVPQSDVWLWRNAGDPAAPRPFFRLDLAGKRDIALRVAVGVGVGLALGLAARGYSALLDALPQTHDIMTQARERLDAIPHARLSYAVMAVLFAPFAEEYLFRGMLYRALDREWGGWRAVLGAAAFFAIYHPVLSWLPVATLGAVNAILFKRTGRLATSVATHMVYNAMVLL